MTMDDQTEKKLYYSFKPLAFEEVDTGRVSGGTECCLSQQPEPRSGHRSVCDDANLYSFGGYLKIQNVVSREQHRLFEELWCFNFAESRWTYLPTKGDAPKELASHCAFLYGNYLHVFGGTGVTFGESKSNTLTRCDLRTLTWDEVKTTGDPPEPRYGQAVVMDEAKRQLYVIGGTTGFEFSMDVHKLDLMKGSWELLYVRKGDQPNEPPPRYRHEVAFDGQNIYVFGGGTSVSAFPLKIVPAFNIETKSWNMLKTKKSRALISPENDGIIENFGIGYPSRRKCHSSVQLGEDVFICGGCNNTKINCDIWKFNIPSRKWHYLPIQMPIPMSFHTASLTSEGCMYLFGGVTDIERSIRTNRIFKVWLKIPKLTEMCWEALLHRNEAIKRCKREELIQLGIPYDFVRRLHPSPPSGKPDARCEKIWLSDFQKVDESSCPNPKNNCVYSFL